MFGTNVFYIGYLLSRTRIETFDPCGPFHEAQKGTPPALVRQQRCTPGPHCHQHTWILRRLPVCEFPLVTEFCTEYIRTSAWRGLPPGSHRQMNDAVLALRADLPSIITFYGPDRSDSANPSRAREILPKMQSPKIKRSCSTPAAAAALQVPFEWRRLGESVKCHHRSMCWIHILNH